MDFSQFKLLSALFPLLVFVAAIDLNAAGGYALPLAVDRSVDPAYAGIVYQSKFVPPDGKYLLIAGQDRDNIAEIPSAWGFSAGGYAHYFSVSEPAGIWSDKKIVDDPRDTPNAEWIASTHPGSALQMALWMAGYAKGWGDYCQDTTSGYYDECLKSFSDFAKSVKRPVFLRIGYEFDGPHNMLEPEDYVSAYRYIVGFIRSQGVSNVAFVWHSYINAGYKNYPLIKWYPGDSYVDWFGMSVFQDHVKDGTYSPYLDRFVDLAREHRKPVMIAESCPGVTPGGGIKKNMYESWNRWFVPYLNYIHRKNIKAFSYINCDWDLTKQFGPEHWGNTRLQDYPLILKQWKDEMSREEYLKESAGLFRMLGFMK
jgi:hypothetical protein